MGKAQKISRRDCRHSSGIVSGMSSEAKGSETASGYQDQAPCQRPVQVNVAGDDHRRSRRASQVGTACTEVCTNPGMGTGQSFLQ